MSQNGTNEGVLLAALRGVSDAITRVATLEALRTGRELTIRVRTGPCVPGAPVGVAVCTELEEPAGTDVDLKRAADTLARLGERFTQASMLARVRAKAGEVDPAEAPALESVGVACLEAALRAECAIELRRSTPQRDAVEDLEERLERLERVIGAMDNAARTNAEAVSTRLGGVPS